MADHLQKVRFVCVVYLFVFLGSSFAADNRDRYCFEFTWVGPAYNNDSLSTFGNVTCADKDYTPPCVKPLVITTDGTPPDTEAMWEDQYNREYYTCKLTSSTVCLKWVNYYNGKVENITYMCGKMTTEGKPTTSACERQSSSGYATVACACTTVFGGIPCNSGLKTLPSASISLHALAIAILALQVAIMRNSGL